ncbi:MAG: SPOR domain-containing protein [Bacteroidota bacterium]
MKKTASYYKAFSRIIGCCLFFLAVSNAHAQTRGTVEVIKDPRIDTLAARRLEGGSRTVISSGTATGYISTDGYRVQFFSGGNRDQAYSAQERLRQKYPDVRTYITYREPDFRVRAGDFRTRLEATKFMQEIKNMFSGLFIISEKINPPVQ